jgi:hypothetical protein
LRWPRSAWCRNEASQEIPRWRQVDRYPTWPAREDER